MSVPFTAECLLCHLGRALTAAEGKGDDATRMAFVRELMAHYLQAPAHAGSPWFAPVTAQLLHRHFGMELDRFRREKQESNAFVLARLDQIRAKIAQAPDPVLAGLQFAILGNYIDFSALHGEVSFEKLDEMLEQALEIRLDNECYVNLQRDLARAGTLVYLTDNAGEIGFDRLFAEELQRAYPGLAITFCVRGGPASNDATREDALAVGLPFPVIDNGNCIPGTQLEQLSPEAAQALHGADVILSKGQGNVETLLGCGLNIYYAFLIKCPLFVTRFQKPKLTPMLLKERG